MKFKKASLIFSVAVLASLWEPTGLSGSSVTYTIQNAIFADGSALLGTFCVDTSTNDVTPNFYLSPSTAMGSATNSTFAPNGSIFKSTGGKGNPIFGWNFYTQPGQTYDYYLGAQFLYQGTFTGQAVLTGTGGMSVQAPFTTHSVMTIVGSDTAQIIGTAPEPSTGGIGLIGALGLIAGYQYRKNR